MTAFPLEVRPYTPENREAWNNLVGRSRNATFLFHRDYCEYHADRYTDASWIVQVGDALLAGLPASRVGDVITSHGGLTYGGFFLDSGVTAVEVFRIFEAWLRGLRKVGIQKVIYKALPDIYARIPAQEDRYVLFKLGFQLTRRDLSAALPLGPESCLRLTKGRKWSLNKARKAGIAVRESKDFMSFMEFERVILQDRHGVVPVHKGEEMTRLAKSFPGHIRLFTASSEERICAGVLVYDTGRVVHTQYISANSEGREVGATDLILHTLITETFAARPWFDFGISTEDCGRTLNEGLVAFKESFGARGVVHDFYELGLS